MEAGSVREALKTWQDNYIHVQGVMDEFVTLRERTKYLRDEVWLYFNYQFFPLFIYSHSESFFVCTVTQTFFFSFLYQLYH